MMEKMCKKLNKRIRSQLVLKVTIKTTEYFSVMYMSQK